MSTEVLAGQKWLNENYGSRAGYQHVEETGLPGSATSAALVSALQIELGLSTVTGVFGDLTAQQYDQNPLSTGATGNKVKILQYGLYSKGYDPGSASGSLTAATAQAVSGLLLDAGVDVFGKPSFSSMEMKAVLGVDEYKLVGNGDTRIRAIQQELNRLYRSYSGICACDGHYNRSTNSALIFAMQALEGMPTSMATGAFGPSTKSYCPDLGTNDTQWGMNGAYSTMDLISFGRLAQYALYCLGRSPYLPWSGSGSNYDPGDFTGAWNSSTIAALNSFQSDTGLAVRNWMGLDEWMGLLVSTGNPNRDGLACDCATQLLTNAQASSIRNDGYEVVGRYLTGTVGGGSSKKDKNLTAAEIETIFGAGLQLFCIFQDDADWWQGHDDLSGYFGYSRGYKDAMKAIAAAKRLGVPGNEYIYFAVDYDFMEGEVYSKIVPHFEGINAAMGWYGYPYRVGIYSARNTCGIVSAEGLASSSFVSDMSTGYSGNLGFPLPANWAFDQIQEYTNPAGIPVDKSVTSGSYMGFSEVGGDYTGGPCATSFVEKRTTEVHPENAKKIGNSVSLGFLGYDDKPTQAYADATFGMASVMVANTLAGQLSSGIRFMNIEIVAGEDILLDMHPVSGCHPEPKEKEQQGLVDWIVGEILDNVASKAIEILSNQYVSTFFDLLAYAASYNATSYQSITTKRVFYSYTWDALEDQCCQLIEFSVDPLKIAGTYEFDIVCTAVCDPDMHFDNRLKVKCWRGSGNAPSSAELAGKTLMGIFGSGESEFGAYAYSNNVSVGA